MSNIKHSSATSEQYTPPEIVEPSRKLMGGITLDPASDEMGNKLIKAKRIYTYKDNGLQQNWRAKSVFLNPPGGRIGPDDRPVEYGGRSSAKAWWFKLADAYASRVVKTAVFVGFSIELLQTTQLNNSEDIPLPIHFPICIPRRRIAFYTRNVVRTQGKKAGELIDPSQPKGVLVLGDSPTHANVLIYLPFDWSRLEETNFKKLFEQLGECVWPSI